MRHLSLFVLLSVAACAKAPPQDTALLAVAAAAVPPGDPVEGARVARRVGCDGCHAEGGKGQAKRVGHGGLSCFGRGRHRPRSPPYGAG